MIPHPIVTAGREAHAMARQAWLVARHRPREAPAAGAERVIVLVHGFMGRGAFLSPLADFLAEELETPVVVYDYASHLGFEQIVAGFRTFLRQQVPAGARIALVGHSLGGLVCRAYVQEHDHVERVERLVTIACPHQGTHLARMIPTSLGRTLRPRSSHVARLASTAHRLERLRPTVIVASHDHIVPRDSAHPTFQTAGVHVIDGVAHNGVLYDPESRRRIAEALR